MRGQSPLERSHPPPSPRGTLRTPRGVGRVPPTTESGRARPGPAARGPLLGVRRGGRATPTRNFKPRGGTALGPLSRPRGPSATPAPAPGSCTTWRPGPRPALAGRSRSPAGDQAGRERAEREAEEERGRGREGTAGMGARGPGRTPALGAPRRPAPTLPSTSPTPPQRSRRARWAPAPAAEGGSPASPGRRRRRLRLGSFSRSPSFSLGLEPRSGPEKFGSGRFLPFFLLGLACLRLLHRGPSAMIGCFIDKSGSDGSSHGLGALLRQHAGSI